MWPEIERLRQATVRELRAKYLELFGQPSRSNHKQFLFRRVAWRLQALAYGDLSERARQRALALAQDADLRIKAPAYLVGPAEQIGQLTVRSRRKPGRDERLPATGSILQRQFKGQLVVVQVLADGFQYQDRFYRSLKRDRTSGDRHGLERLHLLRLYGTMEGLQRGETMMRCAIYTRKSVEEGLAQEFSSLDAQREAGEAYILSQRHAGWTLLPERYDDGGHTGANLERPALERLLADIEAGRIDCVLVYKVDRLSRSLLDFARLMDTFEQHRVSLVSVTQQFNTTASLGRLTLNILLSFAQFERELIAERTRDKMAAARRKGKWVGGIPVLGYDVAPSGRKLVVNEEEARQVRAIFALYLEHGALQPVLEQIERQGWTTKRWTTKAGKLYPGKPFGRDVLLRLLGNVLYAGKIRYQGQIYSGEHSAIVEERVWERVQILLQSETKGPAESRPRSRRQSDETLKTDEAALRSETPWSSVPRITRLLALAWKFESMIQQGVVKDYAELARLGQVSRARVTQIMNLLNLAPDIQEQILFWMQGPPDQRIWEASVRALSGEVLWSRQRQRWKSDYCHGG